MTVNTLYTLLKKLEGKVDSLEIITFEPVTELPETGEPNVIYLVPKSDPETGNYSDEYIWDSDNQTYEKIGDTMIVPEKDIEYFTGTFNINNGRVILNNEKTLNDILLAYESGKLPVVIERFNGTGYYDSYFYYLNYIEYNGSTIKYRFICYDNITYTSSGYIGSLNSLSIRFLVGQEPSSANYLKEVRFTTDNSIEINSNFLCTTRTIYNKLLTKSDSTALAPAYSASATYVVGDLVTYQGKFYKCNTAISVAEAWTAAHWTETDIISEMPVIPTDYTKDTAVTALYDSTATYELGDIVMYNKELYECTTAIPVAEEWDSTHWTKTDIFSQMPAPGGASYVELGGKLLAGDNTLTFNNECITVGSIFEFYTDAYGVNPTDVSVTDGTLVLTFDAQQNNLKVKVRVWEDENPITVIKSVDILTSDTGPVSAAVKFTYKEDNVEISEQTILYSQTDPPINIGDLILVDYGITYAGHWTIKAVRSCVYNGTVYAVGEIIRHWEFTEEVDFTVVENI